MDNVITSFPAFTDEHFTSTEEYAFDCNIALGLYDIMYWGDNADCIEGWLEELLLAPDTDFSIESAEIHVAGADLATDSVIIHATGRVF